MATRRSALKQFGAISCGTALMASGWSWVGRSAEPLEQAASPLGLDDDLANPPQFRSRDGRLTIDLKMALTDVHIPSGPAKLRIYDGALPGPTWRIDAGDTIEVHLHNAMPPNPREEVVLNVPNRFKTTNLC
jgi:FtsP/CotA-like multicopper oxidase with cupredoxin domain